LAEENIFRCTLRGKFKLDYKLKKDKLYKTDIAVTGDFVEFELNKDKTGVIHKVYERKNYISRKAPKIKGAGYRGERLEQIIASNLDKLFIISSFGEPPFNNKVIDRLLVISESSSISAVIVINKSDLDTNHISSYWINLYSSAGYEIIKTSAKTGEGLDALKDKIIGYTSLFWGQSGVGKSSLLNILFPQLNFAIGAISSYSEKGTHTTVTSSMIKIKNTTYIIDTPGIREIDPYGIRKEDLGHYFKDFSEYINSCRFNTCTHHHEPGCAVIAAVESDKIPIERYDSYLRILETVEEDIIF
jgi:ribosome biogenesis GTPase